MSKNQLAPAWPKKKQTKNGSHALIKSAIRNLRDHNYAMALGYLLIYESRRREGASDEH